MSWWLLWWVWIAVAVVLGILEVVLPVFVFLGFSAGAFATALLVAVGVDLGLGGTLLVFAMISSAAYAVLRLSLGSHGGRARIVDRDINEN
jgi:membrane protein implicated in regulation of membrane protease activity